MEQITIAAYANYGRPKGRGLKLHLGCGDYWFEGYINIDSQVFSGTDMIFNIRDTLPFQPETIETIEAHDVVEHFNRDEVNNMLEDWKRVLIPEGKIIISVPDMDGLIAQYEKDKENTIQQIYSIVDHPSHKWGYTKESMLKLLEHHGFNNIQVSQVEYEHRSGETKLKATATK